jgi:hypothetical protein
VGTTELRHGIISILIENPTIKTLCSFFARPSTVVRRVLLSQSPEKFVEEKSTN